MLDNLDKIVKEILEVYTEVLNERIETKWTEVDGGIYTDHQITSSFQFNRDGLSVYLYYSGMGAFILEYGSGSRMTTSTNHELGTFGNPELHSYIGSGMWNSDRSSHGNAFVGRRKGETVYLPNGGTYKSHGTATGKNLETWKTAYVPKGAMNIIEKEIMFWSKEFTQALNNEIIDIIDNELLETMMGKYV